MVQTLLHKHNCLVVPRIKRPPPPEILSSLHFEYEVIEPVHEIAVRAVLKNN